MSLKTVMTTTRESKNRNHLKVVASSMKKKISYISKDKLYYNNVEEVHSTESICS